MIAFGLSPLLLIDTQSNSTIRSIPANPNLLTKGWVDIFYLIKK